MADTLRWFAAFLILAAVIVFIAGIGDVVNAKFADQKIWFSDYNSFTAYEQAKENAVLAQRQAGYNKIFISLASIPGIFIMFMFANMYDNIADIKEKLNEIEQAAQREPPPQQEEEKPVTIQPPPQETEQEPQQEEAPPRPRLIEASPQTPAGTERAQHKNETPQEETAKQVNHVSTVLLVVLLLIIAIFALLYIINLPHP